VDLVGGTAIAVAVLLALPLSSQATDPPPLELTVLTTPKQVPGFSTFYVRLRLANTSSRWLALGLSRAWRRPCSS